MQPKLPPTVQDPALIRLLTLLTNISVEQPHHALPDQLSQWIDWARAVALSSALDSRASAAQSDPTECADIKPDECARLRLTLQSTISTDRAFVAPYQSDNLQAIDYQFLLQRYLSMQQTMEISISQLRNRIRQALQHAAENLQRLAAVDLVLEQALNRRERSLFALVPVLLERRFNQLRPPASQDQADIPPITIADTAHSWLDIFRDDMRRVLLAELDVRLQPAEGLISLLRTR